MFFLLKIKTNGQENADEINGEADSKTMGGGGERNVDLRVCVHIERNYRERESQRH